MTQSDLNFYLKPKSFDEMFPEFQMVRDLINTPTFKKALEDIKKENKQAITR